MLRVDSLTKAYGGQPVFAQVRLELAPGETKKVRFSFEVTYPKDKPVSPF